MNLTIHLMPLNIEIIKRIQQERESLYRVRLFKVFQTLYIHVDIYLAPQIERARERAVYGWGLVRAVGKVWSQELAHPSFNQSQSLSLSLPLPPIILPHLPVPFFFFLPNT